MKTFIVLLRGINVGGRNILPMKALIPLLESNGCKNVSTYIQSGNVVFDCEHLPGNVAELIEKNFGFTPQILFIPKSEFLVATKNCPYATMAGNQVHFFFCQDEPKPNIEKLEALRIDSESYTIKNKVFYLHTPEGMGRSKLGAGVEKCIGVPATARNLNTVNKLIGMLGES